jgi:protein-L-isoaspartate(D-aspartate) O-methyltransferase
MQTRSLFDKLNYHNIVTRYADGTKGWQEECPFDAIVVTAGAPEVPEVLINQLVEGGRLVVPVGNQHTQELIKIYREKENIRQTKLGGCRFVKLVGEYGWQEQ